MTFEALKNAKPLPQVMVQLPDEEIEQAKAQELTTAELNVVRYLGGYFYGRLFHMHPKEAKSGNDLLCSICSQHGQKFSVTSKQKDFDTFVALKRYQDQFSTLFTLNSSLEELVILTIKVTNLVFQKYLFLNRIVSSTALSVIRSLAPESIPKICNESYLERFIQLVVRTILTHKVDVLNKTLKRENLKKLSRKRQNEDEKNEVSEKRRKLTNN